MIRLEDIKDPILQEYLKLQHTRFENLRKYVDEVLNSRLNSRKSINEAFNARLERLEKKGKK